MCYFLRIEGLVVTLPTWHCDTSLLRTHSCHSDRRAPESRSAVSGLGPQGAQDTLEDGTQPANGRKDCQK